MQDVVLLDQERLRRAARFPVQPDAFRPKAPAPLAPAPLAPALLAVPSTIEKVPEIGKRIAPRSATLVQQWLGWLQSPHGRKDELADRLEQAKYRALSNRLNAVSILAPGEQEAVQDVGGAVRRTHQASSDLVVQGEVTPPPMFIVSGWACRMKILADGSRQIVGFLLPGDGIGLRGCAEPLSVTSITALTTLETVDGSALLSMASQPSRFSGVAHAVGRASVQDDEFLVNQIIRLGSPLPTARLAHLILELQWRLAQAGLAIEREFAMPVTYDTLAQAIGLTASSARQSMRKLGRQGMIRFRYGRVILSRPDLMLQLSGFTAPGHCSCGGMCMTPV